MLTSINLYLVNALHSKAEILLNMSDYSKYEKIDHSY